MKPWLRLSALRHHTMRTFRRPPQVLFVVSACDGAVSHQRRASQSVTVATTSVVDSTASKPRVDGGAEEDYHAVCEEPVLGRSRLTDEAVLDDAADVPVSDLSRQKNQPPTARQFLSQTAADITALSSLRYGDALTMTPEAAMHTLQRYLKLQETLKRLATHRTPDVRLWVKLWRSRLRVQRVMLELLCARALHEVQVVRDGAATAAGGVACRALHQPLDLLRQPWPRHLEYRQLELKNALRAAILQLLVLHHQRSHNNNSSADEAFVVTAADARGLLSRASRAFLREARVIGPLAMLAAADFSGQGAVTATATPREVVQVMRAVSRANTHAPDAFWRAAVTHLVSCLSEIQSEIRSGGSEGAVVVPVVRLAYSALHVLKRERWSGDMVLLHGLAGLALRAVSRRLGSASSASTVVVTDLSSFEAASSPSSVTAASLPSSQSRQSVIRNVSEMADGLKPEQLLRLAVIACEVGHANDPVLRSLLMPLLVPVARTRRSPADFQLILDLLDSGRRNVQCVPLYQAVIDALVATNALHASSSSAPSLTAAVSSSSAISATYGESRTLVPATRAVTIAVATDLVRHPELLPSLDLSRFVHLLLLTAREKKKMSPTNIVVLTNVLYQFHRCLLDHGSPVSALIRRAVDEFAYQIHKMLKFNVVSVGLVNHFLEYRILLGMTLPQRHDGGRQGGGDNHSNSSGEGSGPAAVGQHMADLKRTRDALFAAADASGEDFHGICVCRYHDVDGAAATKLSEIHSALEARVAPVYQALFALTQTVYVRGSTLRGLELADLERRAFESGLYGVFKAVDVYYALHRERPNSLETPTQMLPAAVVRSLAAAVKQRLTTCCRSGEEGGDRTESSLTAAAEDGADAKSFAALSSAQAATALGMPHDAQMEPDILADVRSALERRSALYVALETDPLFLRWVDWVRRV